MSEVFRVNRAHAKWHRIFERRDARVIALCGFVAAPGKRFRGRMSPADPGYRIGSSELDCPKCLKREAGIPT